MYVCVNLEGNKYTLIIASGFKLGQSAVCPLPVKPHMTSPMATFNHPTRSGSRSPTSYLVSQRVREQTDSTFNGVINSPSQRHRQD